MATTADNPRYPGIRVNLTDLDGTNAHTIMYAVTRQLRPLLRMLDVPVAQRSAIVEEFRAEAMAGTYADLLDTVRRWVATD